MKQKLALRRPFLIFALASLVLSQSNVADRTTGSTWHTHTNMAEKKYKDTGTTVENLPSGQDGISEYSLYQTSLSSLDVQKLVRYYTTLSMVKEEPKERLTTNLDDDVTNRSVHPDVSSDVTEQVVDSDGDSATQPSRTHVTTPREPDTSDVGRAWYRDSEVRHRVWENTQ
ncbi:hypothetical protein BaRGS_00004098 [Batillaria attramentaria]|uniref:Uncharacterized protein n=1 Tax=Batillaria attramentaria TaxID=370345 RepID=A0ABD0M039_9CAEN